MILVKRLTNLQPFGLGDVILEDEFFTQVTQKDVDFLNTFDVDRLLYNFLGKYQNRRTHFGTLSGCCGSGSSRRLRGL